MQETPKHTEAAPNDINIGDLEASIAALEEKANTLSESLLRLPGELHAIGTDLENLDNTLDAFIAESTTIDASLRIDEAMKPILAEAVVSAINIPEITADDLAENIKDQ